MHLMHGSFGEQAAIQQSQQQGIKINKSLGRWQSGRIGFISQDKALEKTFSLSSKLR